MRKLTFSGLAAAVLLGAGPVHSQAVVETYSTWDGADGYYYFGFDGLGTDAYGQSFQAPAEYLNSWSFWLRGWDGSDASGLMFTANVGTWNGSSVGTVLWTSALTAGTASSSYQQYTFNTGGVSLLTGGQTYIFFLDAVSGAGELQMGGYAMSADYTGGGFYYHNGDDHSVNWDGQGAFDVAFRAEFDRVPGGPGSTVPEPATMTLLATGLAGMAAARKRKKQ